LSLLVIPAEARSPKVFTCSIYTVIYWVVIPTEELIAHESCTESQLLCKYVACRPVGSKFEMNATMYREAGARLKVY